MAQRAMRAHFLRSMDATRLDYSGVRQLKVLWKSETARGLRWACTGLALGGGAGTVMANHTPRLP